MLSFPVKKRKHTTKSKVKGKKIKVDEQFHRFFDLPTDLAHATLSFLSLRDLCNLTAVNLSLFQPNSVIDWRFIFKEVANALQGSFLPESVVKPLLAHQQPQEVFKRWCVIAYHLVHYTKRHGKCAFCLVYNPRSLHPYPSDSEPDTDEEHGNTPSLCTHEIRNGFLVSTNDIDPYAHKYEQIKAACFCCVPLSEHSHWNDCDQGRMWVEISNLDVFAKQKTKNLPRMHVIDEDHFIDGTVLLRADVVAIGAHTRDE